MEQDKLKRIYERAVANSVGKDKKCEYKKTIKNAIVKTATVTLILTLIASGLVGCEGKYKIDSDGELKITSTENQFSTYEIACYQDSRVYNLLADYNFTNYEVVGTKRNYHYTAENYKKIKELDESYLYGFYVITTHETTNEVCKALGYQDLKDFLISNNYVDKNNNPDISVWYKQNKEKIIKIMEEEETNQRRK